MSRAIEHYGLEPIQVAWIDGTRIARLAWPEGFGSKGWSLKNVASVP